ncbi:MAG: hypothetical protein ER33_09280 [Cyanobium sp. CACIAM 14]|nr:MAG: hypothetical protein ER33_09280 [Cyanobium sp. CACIAM 14]
MEIRDVMVTVVTHHPEDCHVMTSLREDIQDRKTLHVDHVGVGLPPKQFLVVASAHHRISGDQTAGADPWGGPGDGGRQRGVTGSPDDGHVLRLPTTIPNQKGFADGQIFHQCAPETHQQDP